jgi:DNA-binding NarL/FixJ family response regulator
MISATSTAHPAASSLAIRVLAVDDNPKFLQMVVEFLALVAGLQMVGSARSGREALAQIEQLRPDLVLMDVVMPDLNGLEVTRWIKKQPDAPQVIILTMHDDLEYQRAAQAVGADGYVVKADLGVRLLPLIRTLFNRSPGADG